MERTPWHEYSPKNKELLARHHASLQYLGRELRESEKQVGLSAVQHAHALTNTLEEHSDLLQFIEKGEIEGQDAKDFTEKEWLHDMFKHKLATLKGTNPFQLLSNRSKKKYQLRKPTREEKRSLKENSISEKQVPPKHIENMKNAIDYINKQRETYRNSFAYTDSLDAIVDALKHGINESKRFTR